VERTSELLAPDRSERFFYFAAVRKVKAGHVLQLVKEQKIKNKKVKIDVAK
jgi:ATP-independent RNA helicase DbpA